MIYKFVDKNPINNYKSYIEAMLTQWKIVYNKAKGSSIIINKMKK